MERLSIKNRVKNVLAGDMSRRLVSFDLVKMLMMLWVVWGHLGLYGIVDSEASVYMMNAKIGVNMPVFFVIAGCFAAHSFDHFRWVKVLSKVVLYLWPHVTLPVLSALFLIVLSAEDFRTVLWHIPFYWFLRTLAMIYIVSAIICKVAKGVLSRWVLMFALYCVMFFLPDLTRWWWCAQVIHMFPYFVFGLMVLGRYQLYRSLPISLVCGLVFLAIVFLQGDSSVNGMSFWNGSVYWNDVLFNVKHLVPFVLRTLAGITGSIFVLFLADLFARKIKFASLLAPLGMTTLGVYVIHEYPLRLIGEHFTGALAPSWTRWPLAIVWFLVCHFVVLQIKYFVLSRILFFGDEGRILGVMEKVFSIGMRK